MDHSGASRRRLPPTKLDISRPEFFPGQSLSDQDLRDLTTWIEQRLRLEASCTDWGIVEGLHVTVDPSDTSRVRIEGGYAFNTARELCVVPFKNTGCSSSSSRRRLNEVKESVNCVQLIRPQRSTDCQCPDDDKGISVGPVSAKRSELVVYDLHLQPQESAEGHALGLSTDGSRNCQPSRIRSSASVLGGNCGQPYREPVAATEVKHPLVQILTRLPTLESPLTGENVRDLQAWLLKEAASFPSLLNGGPGLISQGLSEAELTGILTWLFMTALEREHVTQDEIETIPLARVWARLTMTSVEVLWIDESAPYRRALGCHGPQFSIDQWRGKDVASAKAAAALCGVTLEVSELPTNINNMKDLLLLVIAKRPHSQYVNYVIVDNNKLIAPFPANVKQPVAAPTDANLQPLNGDSQQAP